MGTGRRASAVAAGRVAAVGCVGDDGAPERLKRSGSRECSCGDRAVPAAARDDRHTGGHDDPPAGAVLGPVHEFDRQGPREALQILYVSPRRVESSIEHEAAPELTVVRGEQPPEDGCPLSRRGGRVRPSKFVRRARQSPPEARPRDKHGVLRRDDLGEPHTRRRWRAKFVERQGSPHSDARFDVDEPPRHHRAAWLGPSAEGVRSTCWSAQVNSRGSPVDRLMTRRLSSRSARGPCLARARGVAARFSATTLAGHPRDTLAVERCCRDPSSAPQTRVAGRHPLRSHPRDAGSRRLRELRRGDSGVDHRPRPDTGAGRVDPER